MNDNTEEDRPVNLTDQQFLDMMIGSILHGVITSKDDYDKHEMVTLDPIIGKAMMKTGVAMIVTCMEHPEWAMYCYQLLMKAESASLMQETGQRIVKHAPINPTENVEIFAMAEVTKDDRKATLQELLDHLRGMK